MITQVRYTDDKEGAEEFLQKVIADNELRKYYPSVELRYRSVNYDTVSKDRVTDDKIAQLVVENRLVAFVFMRRDDFNHTEVTCVFIEDAMDKCRKFRESLNKALKRCTQD